MNRLRDGRVAYDPKDDWLIEMVNEQQAEIERLQAELESAQAEIDETAADSGHHLALLIQERVESERLRTIITRIDPAADGATIEARDCAWNLYRGRVTKKQAARLWPWLAEYEKARKP